MRCSAEWLLAREGEPSYRIFIVAGLRLLLNAIAFILEITSSWAKRVQITCTMSEPAIGTPHWKDTPYQIRHHPLTEQFDKELHQGNIDTVFYVLQPYSLFLFFFPFILFLKRSGSFLLSHTATIFSVSFSR